MVIIETQWPTELLELVSTQAQNGETPPETVRRVIQERDAFTASLALVTEERSVLDNYRRALSNERSEKAREEAIEDRSTPATKALQPQDPSLTRFPPVFTSLECLPTLTLFPRG
jgi:hypothetical protein